MSNGVRKLLIIDDDFIIRQSLIEYFEDRSWYVLSAETAEDAIEIVSREKPNAAIVDIRLPGMNGSEFVLAVQKIHPDMVSIICTGSPDFFMGDELKSLENLYPEIFMKPIRDLSLVDSALLSMMKKII